MKRIITFGLLVAAAFALTNCAQKESYTPVQDEVLNSVPFEIVAEIAADTKTYNDGMKTRWSKGDQLKMSYTFEIPHITTLSGEFEGPFTTVEGDGIFTGEIDGGLLEKVQSFFAKLGVLKLSAVYPYGIEECVAPESTVQNGYNSMAHLAGPNIPLKGDVEVEASWEGITSNGFTTPAIKLNHTTSIIRVKVTNASIDPIVINTVKFGVGSLVKATTVVENATELAPEATADIYLVTNPGEINETITFWVNDNAIEVPVEETVTLNAGMIKTMNFSYEEVLPELYAVAVVDAEMTADRIVPCIKTLVDFEYLKEWACNLKNHEDIEGLLEEVLVDVIAGDLEGAYDLLGGLPGFERQFEVITAQGIHREPVNYTATDFLGSFVDDIKNVKDIESLLALLDEFMRYYEVSGSKDQLLSGVGQLSDYLKEFSSFLTDYAAKFGIDVDNVIGQWIIKGIEDKLVELLDANIVDILAKSVADPDGIQAQILNWMFSQNEIRDRILDAVVEAVKAIEEEVNDKIETENQTAKELAIATAKSAALYYAKINAHVNIDAAFIAINENEINKLENSVWGIFVGILNWDKTKALFEELELTKVYDIFQEIAKKVEEVVVYEEGPWQITAEKVDVLTPSEL